MIEHNTIDLPNNKKLSYSLYGNKNGIPILCHHGNPGSRLFWGLLPSKMFYERFYIISPDRPGYGYSSSFGSSNIEIWPGLVQILIDHLDIKRMHIIGVSGGCPYVLSAIIHKPELFDKVILISPLGPYNKDSKGNMNINRYMFKYANKFSGLLYFQFSVITNILKKSPLAFINLLKRKLDGNDRLTIENEEIQEKYMSDILECYRNGFDGSFHDCLIPGNWPIDLSTINKSIHIWYGDQDRSIGNMAEYLSQNIENAEAHIVRNAGHFLILTNIEVIISSLLMNKEAS